MNILRKLFKPNYETFNRIEIVGNSLLHNLKYLKSLHPDAQLFPVLKSNAYGHGLLEVCRVLNHSDVSMVAVDSFPEAQIVYDNFKGRVLIMSELPLQAYRYTDFSRTDFVVYNEETLRHLSKFGKKIAVHLFVDTGMNREGVKNLDSFIARNQKYLEKVELSGLCSHLSSADSNTGDTKLQVERFAAMLKSLKQAGFSPRWKHIGNSAGLLSIEDAMFNAYRPGLAFYGYDPLSDARYHSELKPALNLLSKVVAIHELKAGESVSYNKTYTVSENTKIAVIPIGYYEGLDMSYSGEKIFQINPKEQGAFCRIAGRVCMNYCCVDIGQKSLNIGDDVKIISSNPKDPNSIQNLAKISDSMIYEVLVNVRENIRRIVV